MKLLLVEDEPELTKDIFAYLSGEGMLCENVMNYSEAVSKIALYKYDCIIVDITLPDGNGLELIKQIKENDLNCGILIISAKNSVTDKINGLELGADDYLTKPFHLAEMNARIKSILRRRKFSGESQIKFSNLIITPENREVSIEGKIIDLTKKEYDMLEYFVSNKNKVLTKESIAEHVWGDQADAFDNLDFVYSQIKNIRKKIVDAGGADFIKTVYGIGYKIEA